MNYGNRYQILEIDSDICRIVLAACDGEDDQVFPSTPGVQGNLRDYYGRRIAQTTPIPGTHI